MGWSCSAAAGDTLRRLERLCYCDTKSQNVWLGENDDKFFFELPTKEHDDGHIAGEVYREVGSKRLGPHAEIQSCEYAGAYYISPNGKVKVFAGLPASTIRALNAFAEGESFVVMD